MYANEGAAAVLLLLLLLCCTLGGAEASRADINNNRRKQLPTASSNAEYRSNGHRKALTHRGWRLAAPPTDGWPDFEGLGCITGLDKFAEAFNKGGVASCVDPNIIVRLDSSDYSNKTKMFSNFISGRSKSATFWSYGDNPEKYIRIGRDALQLGNFVDKPPEGNKGVQNGLFPGIRHRSNFAALLEAIGYGAEGAQPKRAYVLVITRKPLEGTVPSYIPLWANVISYFQWYIRNLAAKDPAALQAAGVNAKDAAPYLSFSFAESTAQFLANTTFADLTGCQAQCSVQDNQFGTVGDTSWSSPVLTIARLSKDACDLSKHPAPRYQLRAPTAFNHEDQFCANDTARPFIHYRDVLLKGRCDKNVNSTENRALALIMAREYMAASDPFIKALVLRTYLLSRCSGNFNSLFSGDGFTYTGNAGFLAATGTEFHTGEVLPSDIPRVFPQIRLVFFCPFNDDGTPNPHAICPPSMEELDLELIKQQHSINAASWDVKEVKHPLAP